MTPDHPAHRRRIVSQADDARRAARESRRHEDSEVRASISVRPSRGLAGRLMAEATGALLSAGALDAAISRIGREAATA